MYIRKRSGPNIDPCGTPVEIVNTLIKKSDVVEIRMLRWMSGVTKLDRIRNERVRGTTKDGDTSKKL